MSETPIKDTTTKSTSATSTKSGKLKFSGWFITVNPNHAFSNPDSEEARAEKQRLRDALTNALYDGNLNTYLDAKDSGAIENTFVSAVIEQGEKQHRLHAHAIVGIKHRTVVKLQYDKMKAKIQEYVPNAYMNWKLVRNTFISLEQYLEKGLAGADKLRAGTPLEQAQGEPVPAPAQEPAQEEPAQEKPKVQDKPTPETQEKPATPKAQEPQQIPLLRQLGKKYKKGDNLIRALNKTLSTLNKKLGDTAGYESLADEFKQLKEKDNKLYGAKMPASKLRRECKKFLREKLEFIDKSTNKMEVSRKAEIAAFVKKWQDVHFDFHCA